MIDTLCDWFQNFINRIERCTHCHGKISFIKWDLIVKILSIYDYSPISFFQNDKMGVEEVASWAKIMSRIIGKKSGVEHGQRREINQA
jgi:hypothetical protein